jgi:hypothetical protein
MAAFLLVLFAILNRVWLGTGPHAPHMWWNFTAVGGSLLFFGARRSLKQAWIPVLALMATDYFLTKYCYVSPAGLPGDMGVVRRRDIAGRVVAEATCERSAGGRSERGQRDQLLRGEQFCGVGGVGDVSQDRWRIGAMLRCGRSVLPQ